MEFKLKASILFVVFCFFIGSLNTSCNNKKTKTFDEEIIQQIRTIEIDSCEYLFYAGYSRLGLAHKGNCKYCAERKLDDNEIIQEKNLKILQLQLEKVDLQLQIDYLTN